MDMLDDKDMLIIKLAIYEFGCRNISYSMFVIVYLFSISEKISRNDMLC